MALQGSNPDNWDSPGEGEGMVSTVSHGDVHPMILELRHSIFGFYDISDVNLVCE